MNWNNVNVYYNPKKNILAAGIFYGYSDIKYYLIVKETGPNTFKVIDISETWLDDWEFIEIL